MSTPIDPAKLQEEQKLSVKLIPDKKTSIGLQLLVQLILPLAFGVGGVLIMKASPLSASGAPHHALLIQGTFWYYAVGIVTVLILLTIFYLGVIAQIIESRKMRKMGYRAYNSRLRKMIGWEIDPKDYNPDLTPRNVTARRKTVKYMLIFWAIMVVIALTAVVFVLFG